MVQLSLEDQTVEASAPVEAGHAVENPVVGADGVPLTLTSTGAIALTMADDAGSYTWDAAGLGAAEWSATVVAGQTEATFSGRSPSPSSRTPRRSTRCWPGSEEPASPWCCWRRC